MRGITALLSLAISWQVYAQGEPKLVADIMVSETTRAVTVAFDNPTAEEDDDPSASKNTQSEEVGRVLTFLKDYPQVTRATFDRTTARFTILGTPALDSQKLVNEIKSHLDKTSN